MNATHVKILKGRISPCQVVVCNVNAASPIYTPFRGQAFAGGFTKKQYQRQEGESSSKNISPQEQDSPLQRPPSPPLSPTLSSNSIAYLGRQSCTMRTLTDF